MQLEALKNVDLDALAERVSHAQRGLCPSGCKMQCPYALGSPGPPALKLYAACACMAVHG